MPETVEKPRDRSVEELLGRLKESIRQAAKGETVTAEELAQEK